jgi:hypothetical protein
LIRQKLSHSDGLLGFLFIPGFVGLLWCLGIRCDLSGCESQVVQVFSSCIGSSLDPVTITTSIGDDPHGTYPFGLEPAPRVVPDKHQIPQLKFCEWRAWSDVSLPISPLMISGLFVTLAGRLLDGTIIPFPLAGAADVGTSDALCGGSS